MILKRMKRRHLREDAIRFCETATRLRPEMTFGADFIAGFPTETEAMFNNTLKLVTECNLTWLHVFPYSARSGTPAARMPAVEGRLVRERAAHLRSLGEKQVQKHLKAQVGQTHDVLMESPTEGRTEQFSQVCFDEAQIEGRISRSRIIAVEKQKLVAVAI